MSNAPEETPDFEGDDLQEQPASQPPAPIDDLKSCDPTP